MSTVHFEISYIAGFVINNGVFAPNECKDRTWCIFIPSETRSVIVHFAFSRLMQIRDTGRSSTTASKPALHTLAVFGPCFVLLDHYYQKSVLIFMPPAPPVARPTEWPTHPARSSSPPTAAYLCSWHTHSNYQHRSGFPLFN